MVFKSIYSAACICACLGSTEVAAATVWSVNLINEDIYRPASTNPWTLYIVTDEDQLSDSMIPTGVYIDNSYGTGEIDSALLLSNTPQQLALDQSDDYDIFSLDNSTITLETLQVMPGVFELARLEFLYAEQLYEPGLMKHVICSSGVDYCGIAPGYRDPYIGASFEILFNADPVLTQVATVVPVPAAVWLFGSGLLGLIGLARRKKA
jgi:hypothetical protein